MARKRSAPQPGNRSEIGRERNEELAEFYEQVQERGEPGAWEKLQRIFSDQASARVSEEEYSFDIRERILFEWLSENPHAGSMFLEIAEKNTGLLHRPVFIACESNTHLEREDIESMARLGLWSAIATFDIQTGFAFSTYATTVIRNQINVFTDAKPQKDGRIFQRHAHLDAPLNQDGNRYDTIADENVATPVELVIAKERGEIIDLIKIAVDSNVLNDNERAVMKYRFEAIGGEGELVLREIGERLGVTQERIRQIEAKALQKIAAFIQSGEAKKLLTKPKKKMKSNSIALALHAQGLQIDLNILTAEQRFVLSQRILTVPLEEVAKEMMKTKQQVTNILRAAYGKFGLQIRRHPEHEKYSSMPKEAEQYEALWPLLSSYQQCVMSLLFQGNAGKNIAHTLHLTLSSVYALIYNARQKLGIDVQAIPEMYQQPPPRSKISLKAWARLSPTEKMVAYSTLTKPAKSDHVLQREIGRSDVKTARANARVKLAHPITKVRTKTLPSNATDIVIPEECKRPPAGYEHLAKKWKKLTPRQMMVLYRTLEGKEHAAIAQECDISESTMRQHRQRAMDIVQPTVSTSPDPDLIPEKRWKTLTLNEQKVARARIEDPTIPGTKMAELTGLTNGGITVVVRRLQETLGIDLSRKVLHKDHPSPPPGSGITQEQWNQLKPRHIKVAWVSLAHPDMKPADIAESLGIQKSSRREAGQFVSDLRLQIGRILGTPLHIERSTDPPEAAVE